MVSRAFAVMWTVGHRRASDILNRSVADLDLSFSVINVFRSASPTNERTPTDLHRI